MVLRSLESQGFRNLLPQTLHFEPGVNLLWGKNGAGKSNLLEAIYFLFTTCSFRTQRTGELVAKGERSFRLVGNIETRSGTSCLGLEYEPGRRKVVLDGKNVGLEEVLERFSVLAFSSRQMDILGGGPRERRRFLDRGILALRPSYLRELGEFRRTLAQRNRLLHSRGTAAEQVAWDERFARVAARIRRARADYCERLEKAVGEHARELVPQTVVMKLNYRPSPSSSEVTEGTGVDEGETVKAILAALSRRRDEERQAGHTLVGPHRDEVRFMSGNMDLGRFGSAGQRRASLLALEVTQMELYREARGERPLLLIDDMDSDLDEGTSSALLRRISRSQAFVATCKVGSARRFAPPASPFKVSDGDIVPGMPASEDVDVDTGPSGETTWKK